MDMNRLDVQSSRNGLGERWFKGETSAAYALRSEPGPGNRCIELAITTLDQ